MNRRIHLFLILISCVSLFSAPVTVWAESPSPLPHAVEFTDKLGWTAEDVFNQQNIPESFFSYRGNTSSEDNVVFYYQDATYLFWFHDRVWQVRADERWEGRVDGVSMGMNIQEVVNLWGPPVNDWDEHPTWTLPDRGYPVRIRMYFSDDGLLNDIYVYRGDW
ncbi:MAG: hypothetical protein KAH21_04390 [Spirochaetaceae bacterium]|nr:hypothetical protein [Spirochaetaceae bacterium]